MCASTPSLYGFEMQVGKLAQIVHHFGHMRLFFDLALYDHARGHVKEDALEDIL